MGTGAVVTQIGNPPDLAISKDAPANAKTNKVFTYTLTVTDPSNGCTASDSVRIRPYRKMPQDTTIFKGDSAHYIMAVLSGLSYFWEPSSLVSDPSAPDPFLFPENTTTFTLRKESLCDTAAGEFIVQVEERPVPPGEKAIFIPNVFSPEGKDEADRSFRVLGGPFNEYHLQVFNRWGELVFETQDPQEGWKGRHRGEPVEAGVYVYRFEGVLENGEEVERKGNITLLR
jgi:gliding motility-associated-like protein